MQLQRRVSGESRKRFRDELEYQRALINEHLMPFADNELTDGVINTLCNNANKISKKDDLEIIVPGLSEYIQNDVWEIFEGIF